ncbi:hypothetical protein G6011_05340 [Alternaria panax]|uniref:Uncharacterized protein n=1 Tax=Alternaria panax TaxID=48097 RepID=A0AAD4I8Z7_9PLEO|nr:hypothetical protein G6011_05340 [Alternaria panax]
MASFANLSRSEKRDVIRGEKLNGVQVTMSPKSICDLLDTLDRIPNNKLATTLFASASLVLINESWRIDMNAFPPPPMYGNRTFRPDGDAANWDLRLLATLAILSDFTQGQDDAFPTRKRKTEYDNRRKSEMKGRKDTEQEVDTDMTVGGQAMEQIERRLKKTKVPDDKVKTDSDEDILAPGERMGWIACS